MAREGAESSDAGEEWVRVQRVRRVRTQGSDGVGDGSEHAHTQGYDTQQPSVLSNRQALRKKRVGRVGDTERASDRQRNASRAAAKRDDDAKREGLESRRGLGSEGSRPRGRGVFRVSWDGKGSQTVVSPGTEREGLGLE